MTNQVINKTDKSLPGSDFPVQKCTYLVVIQVKPRTWGMLGQSLPLGYTPAIVVFLEN